MKRPNILILYTDQQRWDALGINGNRDIRTPNLDKLAVEGVNFTHAFVQNPVCMPSRASFLTGQYPSTLGITHMGVPVPIDTPTLPSMLRNYGYTTANVGKLHFLPHANRDHRDTHPDYGFDHLELSDEPGPYEDAYRSWVRRKAPEQIDLISPGLPPAAQTWYSTMRVRDTVKHPEERFPKRALAFRGSDDVTHTAFVADQTIEFIHQNRDRQWLCVAGFYSPHSPWVAPQRYLDLYDPEQLTLPSFPSEVDSKRCPGCFDDEELRSARHGYYAMISEVDHHVGRILVRLQELGLWDNTIVVFTSDHGEWLGEHLRYGKGYPGDDCVSRVPLIVRWPSGVRVPGRSTSDLVEAVDVLPTLLDCAAIQVPPHVQGRSLLWALREGNTTSGGRDSALMEHTGWRSLRTSRYRYIAKANGEESLFDLDLDPQEYRDVSGESGYADALSELRRQLLLRFIEMERPLPRIWAY